MAFSFGEITFPKHWQERRRQATFCCLLLRQEDRFSQEVDARDLVAPVGKVEGVLSRAATGIQDRPGDLICHVEQCLLWPTDFPTWLGPV